MSEKPKILPFLPETYEQIVARLPKAFEGIPFTVEQIESKSRTAPGEHREHTFDFSNGVRMIASRDRQQDGILCDHLSFSVNPGFEMIWTRPTFIAWVAKTCSGLGYPKEANVVKTPKAIHLFFKPQL